MLTIQSTLKEVQTKQLLRAYFSNKQVLAFDISVFNVGANIIIICTDNSSKYQNISKDGYSFVIDNDFYINDLIKAELLQRLSTISKAWTKYCYHYTFVDFLATYKTTETEYQRLLKLENT